MEQCYSMSCINTTVLLDHVNKLIALLNTRVEMDVMIILVMYGSGLYIRTGSQLKLVSNTENSCLFLGFCEDLKVAINSLKTRHPIFKMEHADHKLVLRQPFLNLIKFNQG